jgi:hypothetical protein
VRARLLTAVRWWWLKPPSTDTSWRALRDRFAQGVIVVALLAYPWVELVRQASPLVK